MKTYTFLSGIFLFFALVCSAQTVKQSSTNNKVKNENISRYYFHFTRRCLTCRSVEAETKKVLKLYTPN